MPVKKTGYKPKKVKRGVKHARVMRSVTDFPPAPRVALANREIGCSVKLRKAVYRSGVEDGLEGEFALALPGEYGVYRGQRTSIEKGGVVSERCEIKTRYVTVFLPDDDLHFEWVD